MSEHAQIVTLTEPSAQPSAAPATAEHQEKAEALEGSGRAPATSWDQAPQQQSAVAVGVPLQLPKGCAVGIPVCASFAAQPLPQGKGLLTVALGFIQRDDYHAILELARRGGADAITETRRCGFALALRPEGCAVSELPSTLKVRSANLLHYAVCIGSFRAAAALMVVNPKLLKGTCIVVVDNREEVWNAVELARLFCVLYEGGEPDAEVAATSDMFERALRVLELCESNPEKLPYINLPTVAERVKSAGCLAEYAIAALFAAAEEVPQDMIID
jgi:hypothetical protein